ncbi:MAG: MATE family efflux transporter [Thermodesulfobacteriota bacterium]
MFAAIARRYRAENGYRHVLQLGFPLVVSMSAATVMQFTDRIFLSWRSLDDIAASMPASAANFLAMGFCIGVVSYLNAFVAQYTGAGRPERVGAALWQGLRFAALAAAGLALLSLAAGPVFSLAGHGAAVQALEEDYFRVLCWGSGFNVAAIALSTFYSGRGLTRPVMLVNLAGAALNIPLDYALIFGWGPFPELGIFGAGLATAISWAFNALLFALLVFRRDNEAEFRTRSARAYDRDLFGRLMRFGLPGGAQFCIDLFAFSFFLFLVGRLGRHELAATNIVFTLNHLAFLPMFGLHVAVETLVGQAVGRGRPGDGAASTVSAVHLCLAYMAVVGLAFVLAGGPLMRLFTPAQSTPEAFAPVAEAGVVLLRFVAVYTLFDALAITFMGALKGAGDTRFVMLLSAALSILVVVVPSYLLLEVLHAGLYAAWSLVAAWVVILAAACTARFMQGKWRRMRIIET